MLGLCSNLAMNPALGAKPGKQAVPDNPKDWGNSNPGSPTLQSQHLKIKIEQ